MAMMWLDETVHDIEYFDNEEAQDKALEAVALGITGLETRINLLAKAGVIDDAAKLTTKMKILGWIGTGIGIYDLIKNARSDASYVSQITIELYSQFLYDKDRDTLISRYFMLYALVDKAVEMGAITYCKGHFYNEHEFEVMPGSIYIDSERYQEVMNEMRYSPLDVLELFPQNL